MNWFVLTPLKQNCLLHEIVHVSSEWSLFLYVQSWYPACQVVKAVSQKVIGSRNDGRANIRTVLNSTEVLRFCPIVDGTIYRIIMADKFVGGAIVIPRDLSDNNGYGDPSNYQWLDYSKIFDLLEMGTEKKLIGAVNIT